MKTSVTHGSESLDEAIKEVAIIIQHLGCRDVQVVHLNELKHVGGIESFVRPSQQVMFHRFMVILA